MKFAQREGHDCGTVITTVETAVFELLRQAGTDQFKQVLPLPRLDKLGAYPT